MADDERDWYTLLELPENASAREIRDAFRRLARRYHPDTRPTDPAAAERFKRISAAHDALSKRHGGWLDAGSGADPSRPPTAPASRLLRAIGGWIPAPRIWGALLLILVIAPAASLATLRIVAPSPLDDRRAGAQRPTGLPATTIALPSVTTPPPTPTRALGAAGVPSPTTRSAVTTVPSRPSPTSTETALPAIATVLPATPTVELSSMPIATPEPPHDLPPTPTAAPPASPPPAVPPPAPAFEATDRIGTIQSVHLRSGPGTGYPSLGLLPTGTLLQATGEFAPVGGILWRRFAHPDGRVGWVRDIDVLPVRR